MCTAVTYQTQDFYFGRTLDYEHGFSEQVTVMPRNFPLSFGDMGIMDHHHAMIGMAYVAEDYPLYFDAVNEKGLAMAGLNFVGYAKYRQPENGKDNIAVFEFIPWILAQCGSVAQVKKLLERINLTDRPFSDHIPPTQLHWIIADRHEAITVEAVAEGIRIYPNPAGVLTNTPPFDEQMFQLNNYMHLSAREPENRFSTQLPLRSYSRGMGALGLPGDLSSQSRFVRAAFVKLNSRSGSSETESISQFFHILGSVNQPRGCCDLGNGQYEMTIYTSCCNATRGIYYYTTYDSHRICAVEMNRENLESAELVYYPPIRSSEPFLQNNK
jgi:choloylglycine hydrolase